MTKAELLELARALPRDDRIDLAMDLWDTVDADALPLSDELKRELDRRVALEEAKPSPAEDWDEFEAKLRRGEV